MTHLAQVLMTLLAFFVWGLALLVFLIGAFLQANKDLAIGESIGVLLLFSAVSIALVYGGWRLIVWARSMTNC
jgi:hypothetical protein